MPKTVTRGVVLQLHRSTLAGTEADADYPVPPPTAAPWPRRERLPQPAAWPVLTRAEHDAIVARVGFRRLLQGIAAGVIATVLSGVLGALVVTALQRRAEPAPRPALLTLTPPVEIRR